MIEWNLSFQLVCSWTFFCINCCNCAVDLACSIHESCRADSIVTGCATGRDQLHVASISVLSPNCFELKSWADKHLLLELKCLRLQSWNIGNLMQLPFYCDYQLLQFQKHTIAEYFIILIVGLIRLAGFNKMNGGAGGMLVGFYLLKPMKWSCD